MSNFARSAYHPPTGTVKSANYMDDYFGRHQYGVRFAGDPEVYLPEQVEIPQDQVFSSLFKINTTSEIQPQPDQEVMYWFRPFGRWYFGQWDGEWHFYSRNGFCDGHDAPYWVAREDIPIPPGETPGSQETVANTDT